MIQILKKNKNTEKIFDHVAKGLRVYIQREDVVMIISERSPEMIFSVHAVLKAGGCYVPIDKKLPVERIKHIIEDCKPACILTTVPVDMGITDVPILNFSDLFTKEQTKEPLCNINTPSDLALIIYTSGTTGRPKGVQIEHHSVVNYCEFNYKRFKVGSEDIVLQFASFMFSTYVLELNTPAFGGACINIIKEEYLRNLPVFEQYIEKQGITLLLLPPQYCMYIKPSSKVRIVQTGGMMTTKDVCAKMQQYCKYLNGYGLSEGGVCAVWEYEGGEIPSKIPIAKPVANVKLHVCNGDKECGIYTPGELCVIGQSIARGYIGNEKLTSEKFVKNLFGPERMLRTGDIVQWRPDGNIEYLGRKDTQVQLNGIRVEIDEVENILRKIEGVKNVVVIAHKSQDDNTYLWAYYVADEELDKKVLIEQMGRMLPQYILRKKCRIM